MITEVPNVDNVSLAIYKVMYLENLLIAAVICFYKFIHFKKVWKKVGFKSRIYKMHSKTSFIWYIILIKHGKTTRA